jgi:hypothetical protein
LNDDARAETPGRGHDCSAGRAAAPLGSNAIALGHDPGSSRTMYGPIDAAASDETLVGGVDYGIRRLTGDVAADQR